MSIGNSGRIVIEVDPGMKRMLYSALTRDGLTLKEWFLRSAGSYIDQGLQISLPLNVTSDAETEASAADN